jgi:hypothetical protein
MKATWTGDQRSSTSIEVRIGNPTLLVVTARPVKPEYTQAVQTGHPAGAVPSLRNLRIGAGPTGR